MLFWQLEGEKPNVSKGLQEPVSMPGLKLSRERPMEEPSEHDVLFESALRKYHMGDLEAAMEELSKAIQINPQDPKFYATRGILYCRHLKYEEAIADYSVAIALNEKDSYSYNNRGIALLQIERFNEALRDCEKAVSLNPKSAASLCNRGTVFLAMNNIERALDDLNKAIELDPTNPTIHTIRGRIHNRLAMSDAALQDFTDALRFCPTNLCSLYDRGRLLCRKKNFVYAARDFLRIKFIAPASSYADLANQQLVILESYLLEKLDKISSQSPEVPESRKRSLTCDPTDSKPKRKCMDLNSFPDFRCPITREIMEDPVIADDGHSYERAAIELWFVKNHNTSPMTNEPLSSLRLLSNHALRKSIQHIRISI